jgi:ribosomal protein S6--L-glutamate ligase
MRVLDHMQCDIHIETNRPKIIYKGQEISQVDAIIPRIGSSATTYGAAVIRQFENMGVFSTLHSEPLLKARDKLSCLQILAANGIGVPKSLVSNNYFSISEMVEEIGSLPAIIKMINGTHGMGVILAETKSNAESIMEAFYKSREKVMVQEYIKEAKGADIRVFIVNREIVGVMKRQAQEGEFRSNLHRGGTSSVVSLSGHEAEIALKCVDILGLKIAGVDMLRSSRGPLILEVNASPGLEGIENTTRKDIAGKIISYVEKNVSAHNA